MMNSFAGLYQPEGYVEFASCCLAGLREANDDPLRRTFWTEVIDHLGTTNCGLDPIPVFARRPLDLYKLYLAVVTRGGLVKVIRNRLWEDIVQLLNVPNYATSIFHDLYFKYLYGYEQRKFRFSTTADYYAAIQPSSENPENVALQQMTMRLAQSMSGFPPYMQPGSANSHPLQNMPQMHPSVISYASDAQQNFGIWQLDNIRPGADMRIPAINPSFAPTTATSSSSSDACQRFVGSKRDRDGSNICENPIKKASTQFQQGTNNGQQFAFSTPSTSRSGTDHDSGVNSGPSSCSGRINSPRTPNSCEQSPKTDSKSNPVVHNMELKIDPSSTDDQLQLMVSFEYNGIEYKGILPRKDQPPKTIS